MLTKKVAAVRIVRRGRQPMPGITGVIESIVAGR